MVRCLFALALACPTAHGFQQQVSAEDPGREKDVYAIYSLLLTNPETSHGTDDNERYLIASTTVPGTPQEPCIRPPKERDADFREVLADFQSRRSSHRELRPAFSIRKPFILLSANDVDKFMKERFLRYQGQTVPDPRFQGVTDVFRLSDVYFNPGRTLALTAISTWCGGLCGLMKWRVFERMDSGNWEERPSWVGCVTIARNR